MDYAKLNSDYSRDIFVPVPLIGRLGLARSGTARLVYLEPEKWSLDAEVLNADGTATRVVLSCQYHHQSEAGLARDRINAPQIACPVP
jgi:hypothetical protein